MAYKDNSELPTVVKSALAEAAQTAFRATFNEVEKRGGNVAAFADVEKLSRFFKAEPRSLYVHRELTPECAQRFVSWAKSQGFKTTIPADQLHVTVAYSKLPVDWMLFASSSCGPSCGYGSSSLYVPEGGPRIVERLGDGGATVLLFGSSDLWWRHNEFVRGGAGWDWPGYQPHITISWSADGVDLANVKPFTGSLDFGPEIFEEVTGFDPTTDLVEKVFKGLAKAGARHSKADVVLLQTIHDHAVHLGAECAPAPVEKDIQKIAIEARVAKLDEEHGIVFGFAMICKVDGVDYFDQNVDMEGTYKGQRVPENIPEEVMLKSTLDAVMGVNKQLPGNVMHDGPDSGSYPFLFPLTTSIAKAMGITTRKTGLMCGYKPTPDVYQKYKSGEFTGFSIEGGRAHAKLLEDA